MYSRFIAVLLVLSWTGWAYAADDCRERSVPLSVLRRDIVGGGNLTEHNFKAAVAGKPVRIVSMTDVQQPRRIILLFDVSFSVLESYQNWDFTRLLDDVLK